MFCNDTTLSSVFSDVRPKTKDSKILDVKTHLPSTRRMTLAISAIVTGFLMKQYDGKVENCFLNKSSNPAP